MQHGTGDWWEVAKCGAFPKGLKVENHGGRNGAYGLGEMLRQVHTAARRAAYTVELRLGGTTIAYQVAADEEPRLPGLQEMTTAWSRPAE